VIRAFRLPLAIVVASLGLVACEYRNETTTTVTPPQASLPDDTVLRPQASDTASRPVTEPSGAPANETAAAAQPTTTAAGPDTSAAAPTTSAAAPDTNAMGAAGPVASDGTAAQTELGRFLEESAKKADTASGHQGDKPAAQPADKPSSQKRS
jgi:hypothetical protein